MNQYTLIIHDEPSDVITKIIDFLSATMKKYFGIQDIDNFKVIVDPSRECPEIFKEIRTIYIQAHTCYWCQFIYQYAHEFCHLLISEPVPQQYKWFEESLCELASLFFLNKTEKMWPTLFPYLSSYQVSIQEYIANITEQEPFNPSVLFDNSSDICKYLSSHPYDRRKNRYISFLLLDIFISDPVLWTAVPSLHLASKAAKFEEYLILWRQNTGLRNINKIIDVFS